MARRWQRQPNEYERLVITKLNRLLQLAGEEVERDADERAIERIQLMWLDDLRAAAAESNTVGQSAVVAINDLADKLQEVLNAGGDPAELQALVDSIRADDVKVADAIRARTVAANEPSPVTEEPGVLPEDVPAEDAAPTE